MNFDDVISKRCSIRKYGTKKVSFNDVSKIIDVSRFAPCAGNIHTVRLVVVDDKDKKAELAEASLEQYFIADASYIIVVCSDTSHLARSYSEQADKYSRQQAGAAIENMLLKICELGLASCWIGAFDEEKVREALNIPNHIHVEALLPIAYCSNAYKPTKSKKPDAKFITFFDKWGKTVQKPPKKAPAY